MEVVTGCVPRDRMELIYCLWDGDTTGLKREELRNSLNHFGNSRLTHLIQDMLSLGLIVEVGGKYYLEPDYLELFAKWVVPEPVFEKVNG